MQNHTHLQKPRLYGALLAICLLFGACKDGEVVETIGDHRVTTAEFEQFYEAAIEKFTMRTGANKSRVYQLICDPSQIPQDVDPQIRETIRSMTPRNMYQIYRDSLIVEIVAEEDGFLDRPDVQQIIELTIRQTIAELYMQEMLKNKIRISQEDKQQMCEELRRRDPATYGPLTLEQCWEFAEGVLKAEYYRQKTPEIYAEIRERIRVRRNDDFDRDEWLDNGVELYNTIQAECRGDTAYEAGSAAP